MAEQLLILRFFSRLLILASVVTLGGLSGCGGEQGPKMARVKGRVFQAGQPVSTGAVEFFPAEGRSARGVIQNDGTYELSTHVPGDGALVGAHQVTVKATRVESTGYQPKSMADEIAHFSQPGNAPAAPVTNVVKWLVPEHYSRVETSPLRYEVQSGIENIINIELP